MHNRQICPALIGRSFYAIILFQFVWQMFLGIGAGLFIEEKGGPAGSSTGSSTGSSNEKYFYMFNHFANGTSGTSWPNPPLTNLPICSQRWGNNGRISILDGTSLLVCFLFDSCCLVLNFPSPPLSPPPPTLTHVSLFL